MIIRGDARNLPLAGATVDLIVTSPPFYALRSYTDGGAHYEGQIGSEKTPAEYVDNLIACTREWMRVLKPSGSLWLNLGDKYSTSGTRQGHSGVGAYGGNTEPARHRGRRPAGMPDKSLMGLPWRYALRCIDELGLILRAEVIWSKPNGLPESVTDRVRRSHEQWFHMTRSPRYYSAVDTIRQPHVDMSAHALSRRSRTDARLAAANAGQVSTHNPLGALPGSVWEIPTQPLKVPAHLDVDHFAAFPMEWPRRIIQGWSPSGVCTGCGEGRRPVSTVERVKHYAGGSKGRAPGCNGGKPGTFDDERVPRTNPVYAITGEVCACPDTSAPTRPAVVLDPFGGTGTTALVAAVLGRYGISVDMSADYCRLATWRVNDPGQIAAAMQVDKPPVEVARQGDLLTLL